MITWVNLSNANIAKWVLKIKRDKGTLQNSAFWKRRKKKE